MRFRLAVLAMAIVLAGGGALWMRNLGPRLQQTPALPARGHDTASAVVTAKGQVEPISGTARLTFDLPGRIAEVPVAPDEAVRQGQILARLAADDLAAAVTLAEQALAGRETALAGLSSSRPEDVTRATADVTEARIRLVEAQTRAARAVLRSPIDGVVLKNDLRAGETSSPACNAPAILVGDMTRLRVRAEVPERDAGSVAVGQKAVCRSEALGNRKFPATVAVVARILERPKLPVDTPEGQSAPDVLPVLLDLDGAPPLPVGLRLDVGILTAPVADAPGRTGQP